MALPSNQEQDPSDFHRSGIVFAILVLAYQVMICLFYGYWFSYQPITTANTFDEGQILLVSFLIILAIVGFGLTNAYITNSSFTGMGLTLLIFGLTLEHYFLIKAFWEKAGASDPNNFKFFVTTSAVPKISFVNYGQDRFSSSLGTGYDHQPQYYSHYSFVDAIACALANIVAFGSLVGRIKFVETFFLSLIGAFLYEVNAQLFWRFSISDTGFGMRIFIFGGFMGLISSIILGKKQTTVGHKRYMSVYASRAFGILGLLIIFCTFPCLVAGSLFKTSANKQIVLYSAVLKMYLALVAGILGSFTASALTYRKIFAHDLIFGGLAGGIVYSSSSDLHANPGIPLSCGFILGLICSLYQAAQLRRLNRDGVVVSLAHFDRYIVPGIFCGVLSAILYAINQGNTGDYILKMGANTNNIGQGAMQLAGIGLSIGIGIFAGVIVGIIIKLVNSHKFQDQFRDAEIFRPDFPPSIHLVNWKET